MDTNDAREARPATPRRRPGWWVGLVVMIGLLGLAGLITIVLLVGWSHTLSISGSDPQARHQVLTQALPSFVGCALLGLLGIVVFVLAAGPGRPVWRRPAWWLVLVPTAVTAVYAAAWVVFVLVLVGTGAVHELHSRFTTTAPLYAAASGILAALGARLLVRMRRSGAVAVGD